MYPYYSLYGSLGQSGICIELPLSQLSLLPFLAAMLFLLSQVWLDEDACTLSVRSLFERLAVLLATSVTRINLMTVAGKQVLFIPAYPLTTPAVDFSLIDSLTV